MPKMATKAADNVFYKARIAAASWNDRLGSREGASEVTGIDRTRTSGEVKEILNRVARRTVGSLAAAATPDYGCA